jgi:hypothetical protein
MLATLDATSSVESFDAALSDLQDWGGGHLPALPQVQHLGQRERFESTEGVSMSAWLPRVATANWLDELQGCSLWWPVRDETAPTALSVARGLPPAEHFAHLLEASW